MSSESADLVAEDEDGALAARGLLRGQTLAAPVVLYPTPLHYLTLAPTMSAAQDHLEVRAGGGDGEDGQRSSGPKVIIALRDTQRIRNEPSGLLRNPDRLTTNSAYMKDL